MLEAATDNNDEERSRRLESDAEAVQVLTMHRSKGLEFPVVYYPDLWEPSPTPRSGEPVTFHDAAGTRTIDVGLEGPQWSGHSRQHLEEQRGEDLRLAYVALTRAKHQAVVWWAGSWASRDSALSRLLFARDDGGNVAPGGSGVPTDVAASRAVPGAGGGGAGARERRGVGARGGRVVAGRRDRRRQRSRRPRFDRELDWWWRRTSFSDITAGTYEARVASEPEEPVVDDESAPHAPPVEDDGADELRAVPSLLADMPVGVEVGTLVHRVFESLDFTAADLDAELVEEVAAAQARRRVELGDVAWWSRGCARRSRRRWGRWREAIALRDVARADRLDELDFELPLVGGDDPSGPALTLAAIADVLRAHSLPGDPLAGYAERLLDPRLRSSVRGYLAGSIDLVLRLGGDRFAVVDYKTNWLAFPGEELTAWHHRPAALSAEMRHSHYGLQALLYTVALHRYLRWRLPGYSAERNLAGVLVPVHARDDGPGHAGRRRRAVRRVHLAAAGRARRGAERRPRLGGERVTGAVERDRFDIRLARGASGLLLAFNDAGVLAAADVHVAHRLARLIEGADEAVVLAAALAVRAPRIGHVFVDLERIHATATVDVDDPIDLATLPWPEPSGWVAQVEASGLAGPDRPLQLEGSALYLDRYWREEQQVATDLEALAGAAGGAVRMDVLAAGIARLFGADDEPDVSQQQAAAAAVLRRLAVVAGGPGTGKTTTVARIVALLEEQAQAAGLAPPLVALAAPTGKAAARLAEAVHTEAARLDIDDEIRARLLALEASTLHRLLGWKPGHPQPLPPRPRQPPPLRRRDRRRDLDGLALADGEADRGRPPRGAADPRRRPGPADLDRGRRRARRHRRPGRGRAAHERGRAGRGRGGDRARPSPVSSQRPTCRSATGSSCCAPSTASAAGSSGSRTPSTRATPTPPSARSPTGPRTSPGSTSTPAIPPRSTGSPWSATAPSAPASPSSRPPAQATPRGAIRELGAFRVLCAHRRGPHGVATWMPRIETWLAAELAGFGAEQWYVGRPLLVTENDHGIRLYNGDTGVVVTSPTSGRPTAAFERQGEIVTFSPTRLAAVETVYAMTVHKSQGSQFDTAAVLLPDPASPILTRELLYTAVTRARTHLILAGTEESIRAAVDRPIARASGLRRRLWS